MPDYTNLTVPQKRIFISVQILRQKHQNTREFTCVLSTNLPSNNTLSVNIQYTVCLNAWGDEKYIENLIGNPEVKRSVGLPTRRIEDIKTDLAETACEDVDWIHLDKDGDQ